MSVMPASEFAAGFLSRFQVSAFRLETLDFYLADNEREPYRRFLAGQNHDPEWRRPWQRMVRGIYESGREIGRVHVVPEELTDYLRFELTRAYPASVDAGEDVRILTRKEADRIGLPHGEDYWLFDDERSAILRYTPDGEFVGVELATSDRVGQHVAWRQAAQAAAVPLYDYLEAATLAPAR
ncbi:DUF6879 family protein [Actinorugispora endophytica]|uniref:DUF6879 domain-containing protein n=1 Tax=Actinorugispora endophytica TaxID=1605990 RepID=A0A4R6V269_9ACTN|nr:DUF6879 family protein [Actinorugispora endophytica]TDQ52174.1 hypothetical protein EV190_1074 [Actinorugispora endophytica]